LSSTASVPATSAFVMADNAIRKVDFFNSSRAFIAAVMSFLRVSLREVTGQFCHEWLTVRLMRRISDTVFTCLRTIISPHRQKAES